MLCIPFYLLFADANYIHTVYVSTLEIDEQQMRIKVFTDNLQDAIRNDSKSFRPSTEADFPADNRLAIEAYFRKKIELEINGQAIGFSLKEATLERDSYWITLSLNSHEKWKSCRLKADYLMELFPDQYNVVKVNNGKRQFFRLNKDKPSCEFTL